MRGAKGLGFSIAGGIDDPVDEGDPAIYITNITKGGTTDEDGRLNIGDKVSGNSGARQRCWVWRIVK